MRVVCYARVATAEQAATQAQTSELMGYADQQGHQVVSVIVDSGVSYRKNAASMKKILTLAKRHDVDMVVCTAPSRISREPLQYMKWSKAFQRYGVVIECVKERPFCLNSLLPVMKRFDALMEGAAL